MLHALWLFLQEQVLGMKWLDILIRQCLMTVGIDTGSRIGGSIQFFIYDTIKITLLLCILTL